jgi:hypothetical protein
MIQTQSQNKEIRKITQVWWRVCDKACEKVRYEVGDEVLWKVWEKVCLSGWDKAMQMIKTQSHFSLDFSSFHNRRV